jgi:hypothetical protein
LEFIYETDSAELPLMHVMNTLAFEQSMQSKILDANFISMYNADKKDFEYYIQRLVGIEISRPEKPAAGKIWVPYINARREDWS